MQQALESDGRVTGSRMLRRVGSVFHIACRILLLAVLAMAVGLIVRVYNEPSTAVPTEQVRQNVVVQRSQAIAETQPAQQAATSATVTARGAGPSQSHTSSDLVRALQTRLRWAGCYDGAINGTWARTSQDAMARFLGQVNARLSVDTPDQALLKTLENNRSATCSGVRTASVATGASVAAQVTDPPRVSTRSAQFEVRQDEAALADAVEKPARGEVLGPGVMAAVPSPVTTRPMTEALRFAPIPLAPHDAGEAAPRAQRSSRRARAVGERRYTSQRYRYSYSAPRRSKARTSSFPRALNRSFSALGRALGIRTYR